jgi:hypothetical protein
MKILVTDPEFYSGYRSARVIWNRKGTRKEEEPAEEPQQAV